MRSVRQDRLVAQLAAGPATVNELADVLDASLATIRRDLQTLEAQGVLERTWGGARLVGIEDDPFAVASLDNADAKRTIARQAASLVHDGDTIVLDIGTTPHYLAQVLRDRDLTVITASMPVFETLRDAPRTQLVLLGGEYSPQYQCLEGSMTADVVSRFSADLAFLGCSGVSARGQLRDTSGAQVMAKRAIAKAAGQTVLLADAAKFPGKGSEVALPLSAIDVLVTDQPLDASFAALCQSSDTKVLLP